VTLDADFPVIYETPVAWGEMDSMGHVNNIIYFRYFESARLAYFERVGFLDEMKRSGVGPILATTKCRFRKPLTYPDRIRVGATVSQVQEDRFTMLYCIESEALGAIAADGEGLVVAYDYRTKQKAPLPDSVRRAIRELEER
jgi:acyl-CoA thioester hydrolase